MIKRLWVHQDHSNFPTFFPFKRHWVNSSAFCSISVQLNRIWTEFKWKLNRNGTEIQWKLRTGNECSFQVAWPVIRLYPSWESLTRLLIVRPQFLFNFLWISVQNPFNWIEIKWKLNRIEKSRWVDPISEWHGPFHMLKFFKRPWYTSPTTGLINIFWNGENEENLRQKA